ncbi:hypothetical protein G5574_03635 [Pantoea stewartii]|uniref:hypothetical protein n=1 Tax=Pantoea stewartii TaxID=66269 RepID=UPI0013DE506A|nr:hypothetical protein [Pantoea stewartii]QIE96116.1 hypothetical protein G5574_03635 [Pantoea stewartii]
MKNWIILGFCLMSGVTSASNNGGLTLRCAGYKLDLIPNSMFKINGEYVTSQKITDLGKAGLRVQMGLMPARDGNNYGFEYVHPDGSDSRFLNVQLLQASMDAPRVIGSFPCVKVAD